MNKKKLRNDTQWRYVDLGKTKRKEEEFSEIGSDAR